MSGRTLLSEEKKNVLRGCVETAPGGVLIEVGVFQGGSLLEIAKLAKGRRVMGFDTFDGMPVDYYKLDEFHKPGEFRSVESTIEEVKAFLNPHKVELVPGVFPSSAAVKMLDMQIAFAHLDMDHWRGTLAAINFIWPKLMSKGCILFDDYEWPHCPGIAPVVETWATAMKWNANVLLWPDRCQAAIIKS